jgi:hypothetical protein
MSESVPTWPDVSETFETSAGPILLLSITVVAYANYFPRNAHGTADPSAVVLAFIRVAMPT